jgi:hypothetical protein
MKQTVGQGGFAMVDMGDDGKIPDLSQVGHFVLGPVASL